MNTLSDNGETKNSNVVQIWSREDNSKTSEDPLDDLINEFGTEIKEEENFGWEDELDDLEIDDSELERFCEKPGDYFYDQLNSKELKEGSLDDVSDLVHRARYLSNKLKYYNTYLLNRE